MKNQIINKKIKLMIIGTFLMVGMTVNAQITIGDPNVVDAPIDGFISLGLIAGACIGLRKRIKGMK